MAKQLLEPSKLEGFLADLRLTLRHGHTITVIVNKTSSTKSYRAQLLISVIDPQASEGSSIREITYKAGHVLPYEFDNAQIKVPLTAAGISAAADELVAKLSEAVFGQRELLRAVLA